VSIWEGDVSRESSRSSFSRVLMQSTCGASAQQIRRRWAAEPINSRRCAPYRAGARLSQGETTSGLYPSLPRVGRWIGALALPDRVYLMPCGLRSSVGHVASIGLVLVDRHLGAWRRGCGSASPRRRRRWRIGQTRTASRSSLPSAVVQRWACLAAPQTNAPLGSDRQTGVIAPHCA